MYWLFGIYNSFYLYMQNTFEIVHMCIQSTNANEVLSDSHIYFKVVKYTSSFISMTPYVFFVW